MLNRQPSILLLQLLVLLLDVGFPKRHSLLLDIHIYYWRQCLYNIGLSVEPMEADRDYSIQDDKGVKQVLVRSRLGGYLLNVYGNSLEDEGSKRFFESASHMIQNKDGSVVVVASDKRVVAIDLKNDKKLYDGDFTFIYYISLSPAENFIQIFDKYEINMGRTTLLTFPQF